MFDSTQFRSGLRIALRALLGFPQRANPRQKAQRLEAARQRSANHTAARAMHRSAANAIEQGAIDEAQAFITQGLAHAPTHPQLLELAAICALRQNAPQRAVNHLAQLWKTTPQQRYLLALAQYAAGNTSGAHLALVELIRQHDCPRPARAFLALLEIDRGEIQRAQAILRQSLQQGPDALTCQVLVLTELTQQISGHAESAAGFLAHAYQLDGFNGQWLKSLNLATQTDLPQAPPQLIEQMSDELLQRQHVIPSLMLAQKRNPNSSRINLLRGALGFIVTQLDNPERGYLCLGELALLANDPADARYWTQIGLLAQPYSADLALLLNRIDHAMQPDPATVGKTIEALQRASQAKPNYGDLRRALILLYRKQGSDALAMRHAQQWIDDAPDHPLAQTTLKEIAA